MIIVSWEEFVLLIMELSCTFNLKFVSSIPRITRGLLATFDSIVRV
jgi:hypothetical protein